MNLDVNIQTDNLVIDLDGTLTKTDTLFESVVRLLKKNPFIVFFFPLWLAKGKNTLKKNIANQIFLDIDILPYNSDVLGIAQKAHRDGINIYLATAADSSIAEKVFAKFSFFSGYFSSDKTQNLSGKRKAELLQNQFGNNFAYIGNSVKDIPVWQVCSMAIAVTANNRFARKLQWKFPDILILSQHSSPLRNTIRSMRVYQYVKNTLVFVPIFFAHSIFVGNNAQTAALAFISFSFVASAIYILNDLLDLDSDRRHPRKQRRPFASGELSIPHGIITSLLLLIVAFALSVSLLPTAFLYCLLLYILTTTLYSLFFKTIPIADVVLLAVLYSYRVFAGSIATSTPLSPWLLTCTMFVFLSLAFIKRCAELEILESHQKSESSGRGYNVSDKFLLYAAGISSGLISTLVFMLYLADDSGSGILYPNRNLLWILAPLLVYWIIHLWFSVNRGTMHDDPILFIAKDVASYWVIGIVLTVFALSASTLQFPSPW